MMLLEAAMWVCPRNCQCAGVFGCDEHMMKLVWIPSELFLMAPVDCMRADTNTTRHGTLSSISSCQCTPKFHYCSLRPVVVSSFVWKKRKKKLWSHLDWFARMLWIQFEFKPKPKVLSGLDVSGPFFSCVDTKLNNIGKWRIMLWGSRDV